MRQNMVFSTKNVKNFLTPHPLGACGTSTPTILKFWVRHWLFSVYLCQTVWNFGWLSVCLSIYDNFWTVGDIITKFSWHHSVLKREAKLESGYIDVRGWWFNVPIVLLCNGGAPLANDNEIIDEYDNGYTYSGARVVIKRR